MRAIVRTTALGVAATVLVLLLRLSTARHQPPVGPNEEGAKAVEPRRLDVISTILETNEGLGHLLMEGDMLLAERRTALKCPTEECKWDKSNNGEVEVPYNMSIYFTEEDKVKIEEAMKTFHRKTCIRFVPYSGQTDYISIENKFGCWSNLGRIGGKQEVSLFTYGCLKKGVIQHELLHALGFYHEHTRSDRDLHVRINWEHIQPAHFINFEKSDTNNLDTPYDYLSVMHYGRTAFAAVHETETITPIPNPQVEIGQTNDMSDIDITRINRLYECRERPN